MMRISRTGLIVLLLGFFVVTGLRAQGTYTAASCNQSDVNAVINGPTHTAVNGDTIIVPAGSCTWTSGISITAGITIQGNGTPNSTASSFGAGTTNTVIIDNAGSSTPLFAVTSITTGQMLRLSTLDLEPYSSSASLISPISLAGTCTAGGCPNVRIDNIRLGVTTAWTTTGWLIRTDNVFGVIDHCTEGTATASDFTDFSNSSYLGVGGYGDNSWVQPDTFGGANNIYMENNVLYTTQAITDCEIAPTGGSLGGCRYVARFNQVTSNHGFGVFGNHGLETDGRPQGGRQIEVYGNTASCISSSCNVLAGYRSGTGFVFGNTMSSTQGSSWFNCFASFAVYRTVFTAGGGWGACGGSSPYDTNDGVIYYSGTNSGSSGATTLTDTSKSWTTNQFIPTGAPYSVYDVTQGWWAEIASNTSNTLTIKGGIPEQTNAFNNGDSYQILRATVCADQTGRGAGNYVSGTPPSPASPLSQALDPLYEWDDTANLLGLGVNVSTNTGRTIANRDWYTDGSNGSPKEQTSPTSPFTGASGVGWGTLANRPTTCTPSVGYWATDQGTWNQSGNSFGQGQLFVCETENTWTLHYTPYTYPHPLTQTTVVPPTNVAAVAH